MVVLATWVGCGAAVAQTLVLEMPGAPGSLRIRNPGATAVEIEGVIAIEAWNDGAWNKLPTGLHARAVWAG